MKKILNPCKCPVNGKKYQSYVTIEFENGRISIRGVVGPKNNGNAYGSCGQCVDSIRNGDPNYKDGWNKEMLQKLCDIWDKWHLNDMRAYCQHQKELGWDILAGTKVDIYHYSLNTIAYAKKKAAELAALTAMRNGETFTPTDEQRMDANMPYFLDLHHEATPEILENYEPYKGTIHRTHIESRFLGHLRPEEHPEGILTKPCPICGYGYGTKWLKEDVPQEIIDWLFNLPDSTREPAWVC